MVEKLAAEAQLSLLCVSPSAIMSKWVGESERALRAVFGQARAVQPAAIFLVRAAACVRCPLPAPACAARRPRLLRGNGGSTLLMTHIPLPCLPAPFPLPATPLTAARPLLCGQDELDSLGQARGAGEDAGQRRLLTELLLQMTGAAQEEAVYVFAATNRLQVGGFWGRRRPRRRRRRRARGSARARARGGGGVCGHQLLAAELCVSRAVPSAEGARHPP